MASLLQNVFNAVNIASFRLSMQVEHKLGALAVIIMGARMCLTEPISAVSV